MKSVRSVVFGTALLVAFGGSIFYASETTFATGTHTAPTCKLEITKTVDKVTAVPGDILTYTLAFKNTGTADCTGGGVKVKDVVVSNLEYVSETHSSNVDPGYNGISLYTPSSRTLLWDANILRPGQGGTITWKGKVKTPTICGDFSIENVAHITSLEYSNFTNWVTSNKVITQVGNPCPPPTVCILEIQKAVDKTTALLGDTLTYTLTFKNTGTANCTGDGVRVKDIVDSNLTYLSETHSSNVTGGHHSGFPLYSSTTRTLYWNAHTLTPGESGTITWKATVSNTLACGVTTIPNKASVTGDQYSWQEVWSNTVTTAVTNSCPPPPLVVMCAVTPATTTVGNIVTWTASASGGTGSYAYTWTGTNSLTGVSATTTKTYTTAGTKSGTVTVTSGSLTASATCSMAIVTPPSVPATLIVKKVVINNDGGTKVASDFMVHVFSGSSHVIGSPATASASGTVFTLSAGTYTVGEDAPYASGYQLVGIAGDCTASGLVTLLPGQTKQCVITNDDPPAPPPPTFNANCAASPASIQVGGTITWTATATGGIGSYTYNWTGTDGLTGSTALVAKQYTTTGTKSATVQVVSGTASTTVQCEGVVTNPPPGPTPLTATCVISVGATKINTPVTYSSTVSGGTGLYVYSWSGTDGLSGTDSSATITYLNNGSKNAQVTVTSGSETVTSNLCTLNIIPDTTTGCAFGCGGFDQPTVVLYKEPGTSTFTSFVYLAQQSFTPKVAGIYLSSVPYTGITGTLAVVLFLVGVILWSIFVTFAVESKRYSITALLARWRAKRNGSVKGDVSTPLVPALHPLDTSQNQRGKMEDQIPIHAYNDVALEEIEEPDRAPSFGESISKNNISSNMNSVSSHEVPSNLPTGGGQTVIVPQPVRDAIFARARSKKALVSEEAGKAIALAAHNSIDTALELLDGAIIRTEEKYLKEDGWILLNRDKVSAYLKSRGMKTEDGAPEQPTSMRSFTHEEPVRIPERQPMPPTRQFEAKMPTQLRDVINNRQSETENNTNRIGTQGDTVATIGAAVGFLKAISSGDSRTVMDTVRSIKASGASLENFASDLILELDRAYRARVEGDPSLADQEISRITAPWGARDLEEIIAILFSIAEKEYSSESTGLKLVALRLAKLRR